MPSTRRVTPIALLVAAALLLAGCGGSSGGGAATRAATAHRVAARKRPHKPKPKSLLVRNAKPQPGWRPYTGPVAILVYHELGNPPPSEPYPGLYVSNSDFTAEMQWLHSHGWQAVTLDEVMKAWYHGGTLPAKPIVITFDNGYPPQVTFAPSVMSKYGWPGVLNEITAGHLHNYQIEPVLKLGWEVDSHSVSHPDLTTATPDELRYQLVASRNFLRRTFHIPANSFCYPSSEYNSAVIAAVKAAGYTNAVTENSGYATRADPYLLNRFEIEGGVSELAADLGNGP
ncbi:MAG: polysaccharide deacetylase family protein [Conexibacteraceae bacterium]|nr:polysaccharide deacetylase family protein [Conexibacteraceae bacterium]